MGQRTGRQELLTFHLVTHFRVVRFSPGFRKTPVAQPSQHCPSHHFFLLGRLQTYVSHLSSSDRLLITASSHLETLDSPYNIYLLSFTHPRSQLLFLLWCQGSPEVKRFVHTV